MQRRDISMPSVRAQRLGSLRKSGASDGDIDFFFLVVVVVIVYLV